MFVVHVYWITAASEVFFSFFNGHPMVPTILRQRSTTHVLPPIRRFYRSDDWYSSRRYTLVIARKLVCLSWYKLLIRYRGDYASFLIASLARPKARLFAQASLEKERKERKKAERKESKKKRKDSSWRRFWVKDSLLLLWFQFIYYGFQFCDLEIDRKKEDPCHSFLCLLWYNSNNPAVPLQKKENTHAKNPSKSSFVIGQWGSNQCFFKLV